MGLDHVMILNMEHDIERYWASLGALDTLGFPVYDVVIRHINHNGLDYKDTKSVHQAAIEDGFPEFESFRSRNRQGAAWTWSYRRAMRKIVEIDKTVLVLIDDWVPVYYWTFDKFNNLLAEIEGRSLPLKIIQLPDPINRVPNRHFVTKFLYKPLLGFTDCAVILNAEGAALVLSLFAKYPEKDPNEMYILLSHSGCGHDGLYHTLVPSCRELCGGFPSQNDAAETEPWEME